MCSSNIKTRSIKFYLKVNETGQAGLNASCAHGLVYTNSGDSPPGTPHGQGFVLKPAEAGFAGEAGNRLVLLQSTACDGLCLAAAAIGPTVGLAACSTTVAWRQE